MYSQEFYKVAMAAGRKVELLEEGITKYLTSSLLGGIYVGFGTMLAFSIGALLSPGSSRIAMGLCFGVALSLVIMAGAELFTGNNFVMSIGCLDKTTTITDLLKICIFSFMGNIVGSFIGAFIFYSAGLGKGAVGEFIVKSAAERMTLSGHELISRGILCNLLVCSAIWCAYRLENEVAKLIMIFWGLFAFVSTGFQNSVANMTLLWIALLLKHTKEVNLGGFIHNIGFVTIGNIIGGIALATAYYIISKEK